MKVQSFVKVIVLFLVMKGLHHYIQKELATLIKGANKTTNQSIRRLHRSNPALSVQSGRLSIPLTINTNRSSSRTVTRSQLEHRPKTANLQYKSLKDRQFFIDDLLKVEQSLNKTSLGQYQNPVVRIETPRNEIKFEKDNSNHSITSRGKKRLLVSRQLALPLPRKQPIVLETYLKSKMCIDRKKNFNYCHTPNTIY